MGVLKLRRKNLAVGTAVFMVSLITLLAFATTSYETLQAINPVAASIAIAVAVIGIAWFKKTR